jgi:purine-binding chemotaxis protein CheW
MNTDTSAMASTGQQSDTGMARTEQLSTFFLGGLFFGIEVTRVQEVIRYQTMTPVPLAPAVVTGLINLRGQIVTAIDLRQQIGCAEREEGALPMNVVVRTDIGAVSLLVDEIDDVVEVDTQQFQPPPSTVVGLVRDLITGVYQLPERLLLVLDVTKAVQVEHAPSDTEGPHPSGPRLTHE